MFMGGGGGGGGGKLEQAVNQYFVQILSLVTDNNPSSMIQQKGGD